MAKLWCRCSKARAAQHGLAEEITSSASSSAVISLSSIRSQNVQWPTADYGHPLMTSCSCERVGKHVAWLICVNMLICTAVQIMCVVAPIPLNRPEVHVREWP